ncbi:MAG: formate dehydrogenase accessory protein FdhE [Deltaproteobacteria bacterium]|nr:formate dehydrogenase accessory protein FdhE [Deltaproteobacteria bacterium]
MTIDYEHLRRLWQKKIKALSSGDLLPAQLLTLVTETVSRQMKALETIAPGDPDPKTIESPERNLQGVPLCPREAFGFDPKGSEALFRELLGMLKEREGELATSASTLNEMLNSGEIVIDEAFIKFVQADDSWLASYGERTPQAPRLLNFLVQSALTPGLMAFAAKIALHYDSLKTWQHGHCPICGSPPLIGSLRQIEGHRFLTCSFCLTDYRAKRLQCPFCREENTARLEYFEAKEVPGFRVEVCRSCMRYIKTADFRNFDKVSVPVLDDLESLALDILARENGFQRPTLSAWGF